MVGFFGAVLALISGDAIAADVPKLKCTTWQVGKHILYLHNKIFVVFNNKNMHGHRSHLISK
jgi:hypothetical protein